MTSQFADLEALLFQEAPPIRPRRVVEEQKFYFDAGRFRWLFSTLQGQLFLDDMHFFRFQTPEDLDIWREAIDREIAKHGPTA